MNKEFVPYEIALALKELGFNEPCFRFKNNISNIFEQKSSLYNWNQTEKFVSIPTFSQVFRFFREKYKLNCFVTSSIIDGKWYYYKENLADRDDDSEPELTPKFNTYEEAELACLEKLIEIVKK
jgi:hypothetical protein